MRSLVPGDRIDRYVVEGPLGKGGMAEVVRALDPKLGRRVALKRVLRDDVDDASRARLVREARAAAALDHPNVVAIFDVGEADGAPFIAMELVVGKPLRHYVGDAHVSMRRRVTWLVEIARALAAAHERGLVHRDVKPENVMVRDDGTVKVVDFGIARAACDGPGVATATGEAWAPTITGDGAVVGTVPYMAPEQARGAAVDARADQFAWGIVAYELLAGAHPWGAFAEKAAPHLVMSALLFGDPPSLASVAPATPAHVVAAIERALSKQPDARFATMDALVEALVESAESLPRVAAASVSPSATTIESRPDTVAPIVPPSGPANAATSAGGPWARARVAVAALAALALVGGAGRYVVLDRAGAADHEHAALQLGQAAARVEATLRRGAILPLHDTRRERAEVLVEMRRIEDAMERSPSSRATGAYALGRAYLALRDPARARAQLEQAATLAPDAHVEEALGEALGELYRAALIDAQRVPVAVRDGRLADAATSLRDPALAHLLAARAQGAGSDRVEGLIALYERRYDDAIAAARAAFARDPSAYDAKELEGDIEYSKAGHLHFAGKHEDADAAYERAGEAFRAALAIARSSPTLYTKETRRHAWQIEVARALGRGVGDHYARAIEASDSAVAADPDDANAWRARAEVAQVMGSWESGHGKDPSAAFAIAVEAARRAVALAPTDDDAHIMLANTLSAVGMHERYHGADPTAALEEAIDEYDRALARGARSPWHYNGLGRAREALALFRSEQGIDPDPRAALRASIDAYHQAVARYPTWTSPYINVCNASRQLAEEEMARGIDPRATLDGAADAADAALSVDPTSVVLLCNRALIDVRRGEAATMRGDDATASFAAAMPRIDEALRRNPRHAHGIQNRGEAWLARASDDLAKGRDPSIAVREALRAFDERLKLDPQSYWARRGAAEAWLVAARDALARGKDPAAAVREAEREVEAALRVKSDDLAVRVIAAEAALVVARTGDGEALARAGTQAAAVAERAPNEVRALRVLADVHRERARRLAARGGDPAEAVRAALEACARVDALIPGDARALAIRGAARLVEARAHGDAAAEAEARADVAVAIARDARLARDFRAL